MPCGTNANAVELTRKERQAKLMEKRTSCWMKLLADAVDTIANQDHLSP